VIGELIISTCVYQSIYKSIGSLKYNLSVKVYIFYTKHYVNQLSANAMVVID
jgi:hypothetical protein